MTENLNPLNPEENLIVDTQETGAMETAIDNVNANVDSLSKNEIIEQVKNIAMLPVSEIPARSEVEKLKQAYYKIKAEEIEAQREAYLSEEGNEIGDFVADVDPTEEVIKTYLNEIKNKRAEQIAEENKIKEANYKKKLVIIDEIKALTESTEDFNKLYKEFKDLQDKWAEIKSVPQAKEKELWAAYQVQTELFYDLIKINNEFRDYDFKKNLERKIEFCEAAEKLIDETDPVSAFHQLQNYHKQWREVGPVAREQREDIWTRFKTASTAINKKYQDHFEGLKEQEDENLAKKAAICEKLKTIDYSKLDSFKKWNDKTKQVIDIQAEWKTIGFVPRKFNTKIYEEFRAMCDEFFSKKSNFFKGMRDSMDENLEKKRELCARAIELKDSTDWKNTTKQMVEIQKKWKEIGPVPRKYSDAIWKEFVGACDAFFEKKKATDNAEKTEEVENLKAKTDIVEKIKTLDTSLDTNALLNELRILMDEWHKIGFVPFKQKDRCYDELHKAVDTHYDRLKIDKTERRMENFKSNVEQIAQHNNPERALKKERDQLLFKYNKLKGDLQTYENNMSFLSISSKGAGSLLKDVNNKIDSLKEEMELLAQKIATIDDTRAELK